MGDCAPLKDRINVTSPSLLASRPSGRCHLMPRFPIPDVAVYSIEIS
jgi:hypothetical protein